MNEHIFTQSDIDLAKEIEKTLFHLAKLCKQADKQNLEVFLKTEGMHVIIPPTIQKRTVMPEVFYTS